MAIALLLIERDGAHRRALRDMLATQHAGWRLALAGSLAQARELLRQAQFDRPGGQRAR
jgi:hypothetical protein